jgi:predicted enzyme related to lactoylglutathione lyase
LTRLFSWLPVSIDLHAAGDRTDMVFTHTGFADDASRERHNEGWNGSFNRMDNVLVKAPLAIRGIDLHGYMCKDAERAIAFYRDLFGLEPSMVYPEGRGAEFELPDGSTFGLWGGGGKVMPFQPSNGILFAVDDLQAAIAAVTARGLAVHYQTETPNCTMAMINDSEGNILTLHQRKR